jgi:hypothetical protein
MKTQDRSPFHQLYGEEQTRMAFKSQDFVDYTIMSLLCMLVIYFSYGARNPVTWIGIALSAWMIAVFPLRHGWTLALPLIVRRPQEIVYTLVYKVRNLKWMYLFALALLLLENYLISLTPGLPHHVALMREIAYFLFYASLAGITLYRTYIFYVHLRKKALVREVLLQTVWKKRLEEQPSLVIEIAHAYVTGLLTHVILVAPWFLVITYFNFSVLFLPVVCAINLFTQVKYLKVLNAWYYRDHWLSHHTELDFIYLHGSHHDAIPSGLIGVAGNGILEGLTRHGLAAPTTFFNPLISTLINSYEIKGDIDAHQYIPGLYPKADINRQTVAQHSMHHFGRLKPYGFGMGVDHPGANETYVKKLKYLPEELKNSIKLDQELDGFEWDSKMYADYLELVAKYEKSE